MSTAAEGVDLDESRLSPGPNIGFSLLVVCTGNICRSPAAEALFAEAWPPGGSVVDVSSAGTGALVGSPIDPSMKALLPANDRADTVRARQLDRELISAADLVLTMTQRQRSATVLLHPASLRYSFTLLEFARILSHGLALRDDDSWRDLEGTEAELLAEATRKALIDRVKANSGQNKALDEVADPYGRSSEAFSLAFADIHRAVKVIADFTGRPLAESVD